MILAQIRTNFSHIEVGMDQFNLEDLKHTIIEFIAILMLY